MAVVGSLAAALVGGSLAAVAGPNHGIQGKVFAFAVSGGHQIQQLFVGSDGQLWFTTTQSQFGEISSAGVATLSTVTLPHGNTPAVIAAAGPEGVWSYSDTTTAPTGCGIVLVTPDGTIHNVVLPAAAIKANSLCSGAVADGRGNLWVSLDGRCQGACRVAIVAEITPAGVVTEFGPDRPGARPGAMALGTDGQIWVLEGGNHQEIDSYTSAGLTSSFVLPFRENESGTLLARPDGTFWFGPTRRCNVLNTTCTEFDLFDPATLTTTMGRTFPVGSPPLGPGGRIADQFAVDPSGAVWASGQEAAHANNRLFRMNSVDGSINRSDPFPLAGDGTTLSSDGTIAITSSGTVWASATSGSGQEYLLRLQPLN